MPAHASQDDAAKAHRIDWAAALAEHERWLYTVLLARLRDRHAVEEVMQEVSLAAIKQRPRLSGPEKAGPWLYRVAVRQALLYRRSRGRARKLTDRYADRERPTEEDRSAPDPLGWLLADEQRAMIRKALSSLPERDAEVLLLKYTEGWSYQQMAEHLGVSVSSIESRLHRARRKMRSALAALDVIEVE